MSGQGGAIVRDGVALAETCSRRGATRRRGCCRRSRRALEAGAVVARTSSIWSRSRTAPAQLHRGLRVGLSGHGAWPVGLGLPPGRHPHDVECYGRRRRRLTGWWSPPSTPGSATGSLRHGRNDGPATPSCRAPQRPRISPARRRRTRVPDRRQGRGDRSSDRLQAAEHRCDRPSEGPPRSGRPRSPRRELRASKHGAAPKSDRRPAPPASICAA